MGNVKVTGLPTSSGVEKQARGSDLSGGSFKKDDNFIQAAQRSESLWRERATHKVKSGETFTSIAKEHHVDVKALMQANKFREPKSLKVGDKLTIPGQEHVELIRTVTVTGTVTILDESPEQGYKASRAKLDEVKGGKKQLYYRPGVPLDSLPVDPAVQGFQQLMLDLHLDGEIKTSGKFDRKTDDMVRDIERRFNLPQTGIVGTKVIECVDLLTKEYERIQKQNARPNDAELDKAIEVAVQRASATARSTDLVRYSGAGAGPVAIIATLNREGGTNSSKADNGNKGGLITNMGITGGFYNEYRQTQGQAPIVSASAMNAELRSLNSKDVSIIYQRMVFDRHHLDRLPPLTAIPVHDMIVVHGPRSIKLLQRILGVSPTGFIGDQTAQAAQSCKDSDLVQKYTDKRKETFRSIAANNPSQDRWLGGWVRRADEVAVIALSAQSEKMIRFYCNNGVQNWDILDPIRHGGMQLGKQTSTSNYIVLRRLQEQINESGLTTKVSVDGKWGSEMDRTLVTLRSKWNLPASNVWDSACQNHLDTTLQVKKSIDLARNN